MGLKTVIEDLDLDFNRPQCYHYPYGIEQGSGRWNRLERILTVDLDFGVVEFDKWFALYPGQGVGFNETQ